MWKNEILDPRLGEDAVGRERRQFLSKLFLPVSALSYSTCSFARTDFNRILAPRSCCGSWRTAGQPFFTQMGLRPHLRRSTIPRGDTNGRSNPESMDSIPYPTRISGLLHIFYARVRAYGSVCTRRLSLSQISQRRQPLNPVWRRVMHRLQHPPSDAGQSVGPFSSPPRAHLALLAPRSHPPHPHRRPQPARPQAPRA